MRLINHQQRAIAGGKRPQTGVKPGSGSTMQELVITGSVRIAATSPLAKRRLDPRQIVELAAHRNLRSGRPPAPADPAG